MTRKDKIKLKEEQKKKLIHEIRTFFVDYRGEEIGELQAEILCDFVIKKVGKAIYNQALHDAKNWFENFWQNSEADFYTLEK